MELERTAKNQGEPGELWRARENQAALRKARESHGELGRARQK